MKRALSKVSFYPHLNRLDYVFVKGSAGGGAEKKVRPNEMTEEGMNCR